MEEPGRNCDNCDIRNSVRVLVSVSLNLKQGCFSVVIETTRGYDVRRKIFALLQISPWRRGVITSRKNFKSTSMRNHTQQTDGYLSYLCFSRRLLAS